MAQHKLVKNHELVGIAREMTVELEVSGTVALGTDC